MAKTSEQRPSYLGLLNAVSVAETAAEPFLLAWADSTTDNELADTLRFVAMREGEHGKAFAKRMLELGYDVRQPVESGPSDAMRIVTSKKSDIAKFRALKLHKAPGKTDIFDTMFTDKNIDPTTGGLLGRYIAEERDSGRRLAAEYDRLVAAASKSTAKKTSKKKPARKGSSKKGG